MKIQALNYLCTSTSHITVANIRYKNHVARECIVGNTRSGILFHMTLCPNTSLTATSVCYTSCVVRVSFLKVLIYPQQNIDIVH